MPHPASDRVVHSDPEILGGTPVFVGTRGPVQNLFDYLAAGGAAVVGEGLKDLDVFPLPEDAPEFYVDYGETGPYVKEIGESECAT